MSFETEPDAGPEFKCNKVEVDGSYDYTFYNDGKVMRKGNSTSYSEMLDLFRGFELEMKEVI